MLLELDFKKKMKLLRVRQFVLRDLLKLKFLLISFQSFLCT